jgi:hypothetical protein
MKDGIFCDVTLYNLVEVYRRFGVTYCLHLQSQKVSQASGTQSNNPEDSALEIKLSFCVNTVYR